VGVAYRVGTQERRSFPIFIDYRVVNRLTKKSSHPLPRIEDTIEALAEAKYLHSLDIRSAHWQVPVAPEDQDKTAFVVPGWGELIGSFVCL